MLSFFHDHIFLKYENNLYTSGSLNDAFMKRYIKYFGNIRVISRQKDVGSIKDGVTPSNIANTEFVEVPNYKNIRSLFNYFKAKKIIKAEVANAECIILRTSSIANIAARYARKYNKKYLVEVVGCAWDASWNYSVLGKLIAPFSFLKQRKTVRDAAYAVYVTNQYLQNKYPNKKRTTHCSNVSLTEFNEETLDKRFKKIQEKSSSEIIVIGTTAAVDVRYKGQQYIIEVLSKLKRRGNTNYFYQLVGGGDQSYLRSLAEKFDVSEQVEFLGTLTHDEVIVWLDTIDVYAQPSRQEGLPRALIEAMSRGLPAIGARTAGIPELLEPEYIFSNTRKNIDEIIQILESYDKDSFLKQSQRNYGESKQYDKGIIENRRQDIFRDFIEEISKKA